ncbi:immunoglobulin-like domain-containing protein, partial [Winogradskyella sp.]|uniref:immunoglobulin-like domain-containing protein n=1 Tax=Winogradskyella sp. TaxID=1883156 RepID=UPI0025FC1106
NVNADTTPPVITLIGSSTINLTVGDTYTDQGATATDNLDGDLTSSIVVVNNVNTSLANSYAVTYNVSDAAGNAAIEVVRTVNVSDPSSGCSGGVSTYPYAEGFEGSIGMWSQSTADDLNWTVDASGTPSSGTGPSSAVQGSDYIYVEASGNGTGYPDKRAIITSPCFDLSGLTNPVFSFQYHMYGASNMGSIDLEISDDDGANWTSIWNQTGNQGNQWLKVELDLSAYIGNNIQVRFNRFVGSTWQADIAIDDVQLFEPAAPTCNDGIQNGDETGVDCGGSSCAPCSTANVVLNEGYFETGWDNWQDGGSDCARVSSANSYEGNYSIRIRDNSGVASAMTLSNIDVSPYSSVEIDFYFYVFSMENGEDFWLRFYDGSTWSTVQTWARGTDIENNTFYNATVTLTPAQYNFAVNSGFRFQCDASGNQDQIFIDQVTITGISGSSKGKGNQLEAVGYAESPEIAELDINLYPNPVKGSILNVEIPSLETFKYRIVNIQGRTVLNGISEGKINVSKLDGGMYFIEVNDGDEIITKKFIKD